MLGSLRLQLTGTKQVVCIAFEGLYSFMNNKGVAQVKLGKLSEGTPPKGYDSDAFSNPFR